MGFNDMIYFENLTIFSPISALAAGECGKGGANSI